MTWSNRRKIAALIAAVGAGILLDQWTKNWAEAYFAGHPPLVVIGGLLELRFVENAAVAFSLMHSIPAGLRYPLIYAANAVALTGLAFLVRGWLGRGFRYLLPPALIAGGALGNLFDRIRSGGYVRDFVHLHYKDLASWPIFNVADTLIFFGVVFFLWFNRRELIGGRGPSRREA